MPPTLDIVMVAYHSEVDLPHVFTGLKTGSAYPHTLHFYDNFGNKKTLTIAWNDLAREGKAEYIVFLNTDIRLSPEWDRRLVEGMERHPDAAVVLPNPVGHGWPQTAGMKAPLYTDPIKAPAPTPGAMAAISEKWASNRNDISFGDDCNAAFFAVMVRRDLWEKMRGFDERFRLYGQDHDFQRRCFWRERRYSFRIASSAVWHRCAGSVRKAASSGEVNMQAEMVHCGETGRAIIQGKMPHWDHLSDAQRSSIRKDPRYNRMPR